MYLSMSAYPARLPRYCGAAFVGVCITIALLWLMTQLIRSDQIAFDDTRLITVPPFVEVREDLDPEIKKPHPEPPPTVEPVPTTRPMPTFNSDGDFIEVGNNAEIKIDHNLKIGTSIGDGDPLPIVKVAPSYPERARRQGIEGYVVVSFTITETGRVIDAVVVEAVPGSLFDRAATTAVERFKYKPRILNGKPTAVEGMLHRLTFELANG